MCYLIIKINSYLTRCCLDSFYYSYLFRLIGVLLCFTTTLLIYLYEILFEKLVCEILCNFFPQLVFLLCSIQVWTYLIHSYNLLNLYLIVYIISFLMPLRITYIYINEGDIWSHLNNLQSNFWIEIICYI